MLLLIDNYDSFTHNLSRYFAELGTKVEVVRNDQISGDEIARLAPRYLVISPGPCTPNESGVSLQAIQSFAGQIPILGVCLGHQAIGQVFGASVVRAQRIMHGKTSEVAHVQSALFKNVASPFSATRYHSLVLDGKSIPDEFEVTAWTMDEGHKTVMAIEHRTQPIYGVQFHPESMLTASGHQILSNFLHCAEQWQNHPPHTTDVK